MLTALSIFLRHFAVSSCQAAGYGLYHPHPYATAFPWHPATAHMWSAGTVPTGPLAALGPQHGTVGSPQSRSSPGSVIGVTGSDVIIPRLIGLALLIFFVNLIYGDLRFMKKKVPYAEKDETSSLDDNNLCNCAFSHI